jgi:hypothetical protein
MKRKTLAEIQETLAAQEKEIDFLVQHWESMITRATGGETPERTQFAVWLRTFDHDLEMVIKAIDATARKNHSMGRYRLGDRQALSYVSGCLRRIQEQRKPPDHLAIELAGV